MAHGGTFPYYDAKEFDCRILGLPYKRNLTTMYIILPNNSNRDRLRQMQAYLTPDKIESMISKMELKTAIILFPKMHIINQINLKKIFYTLGVRSLFEQGFSDLSLIAEGAGRSPYSSSQMIPSFKKTAPANSNRFNLEPDADEPFIFSRHGEDDEQQHNETTTAVPFKSKNVRRLRTKRNVSYKVPSTIRRYEDTLRLKDYIVSKRITKSNPGKKHIRSRRQTDLSESIKNLDRIRAQLAQSSGASNPGLYAEEIVHKIDLTINEKGTEGGAATATFLYRTGTDAVFRVETPFIFLIRHDDTKLPLFYGTVYEPTNF